MLAVHKAHASTACCIANKYSGPVNHWVRQSKQAHSCHWARHLRLWREQHMQGSSNMCMDAMTNLAECGCANLARGNRLALQQLWQCISPQMQRTTHLGCACGNTPQALQARLQQPWGDHHTANQASALHEHPLLPHQPSHTRAGDCAGGHGATQQTEGTQHQDMAW